MNYRVSYIDNYGDFWSYTEEFEIEEDVLMRIDELEDIGYTKVCIERESAE